MRMFDQKTTFLIPTTGKKQNFSTTGTIQIILDQVLNHVYELLIF